MTPRQLEEIEAALLAGPMAWGYATDLWTLPRIAGVIWDLTGAGYHPGHVWRVLRKLGWSRQKPITRARERDEDAIGRWIRPTWPAIKKAAWLCATIVFVDETGFSERPSIRQTWAPRGQTPVLSHCFRSWKNLSAIGGPGVRTARRAGGGSLMFSLSAVRSAQVVRFLEHLRRHIRGRVLLIWDALNAHRSIETHAYLQAQRSWLTVYRLPPDAPELNPVEGLWAWFKGTTVANLCALGLHPPIRCQLRLGRRCLARRPALLRGFLHKAGLFFDRVVTLLYEFL